MRVLSIFGTRPEAIKMGPVVKELERHRRQMESLVCVTAQHREMLDQVLTLFDITPHIDLDLMEDNQTLPVFTGSAIGALSDVLQKVEPDCVLVQGDTTTAMVAALAAFYHKIPVGHVEAGLRTRNRYSPFPEEVNRRLLGVLSTYHFAPTRTAADALLAEGIPRHCIFVTGNPVIDALHWTLSRSPSVATRRLTAQLGICLDGRSLVRPGHSKVILVTAHRRESFGPPLERICYALREITERNPDVEIFYPVHMNPQVHGPVYRILAGHARIRLTDPLDYESFAHVMKASYLVLTDSGGIQEEAPTLGKPVLVLREETERPEAVEAGTVKVVGTEVENIVRETQRLLSDREEYCRMSQAVSPYGDGHAAERIVSLVLSNVERRYPERKRKDANLPEV